MNRKLHFLLLSVLITIFSTAKADEITIGEDGINSLVTGLDGTGALIGQIELSDRPRQGLTAINLHHRTRFQQPFFMGLT